MVLANGTVLRVLKPNAVLFDEVLLHEMVNTSGHFSSVVAAPERDKPIGMGCSYHQ